MTGLSGAGKTTLCEAVRDLVKPHLPELVLLDGDVVRAAFGHNLSHSESDRITQVRRLQSMSRVLAEQGLAVLVGVLYGNAELLAWNRENLPNYFEVYLNASLETAERRDAKGLYEQARTGLMSDVVGIDIPWYEPIAPDLVSNQDCPEPPEILARRLANAVPRLRMALSNTPD
ncbi:MAG: adenylyl-sulfate kinase [Rhodospirillaceae bacterium]|nr:adenylyl-sulfate kinase [Rhodospirillaceae bacterium]